jgi:protein-tyrosine phosphatase
MSTEIHWLGGPWPGKLALAARPRGGEWLEEEVASWKQAGVNAVLSLLTSEEEQDLELSDEAGETSEQGLEFSSFPIPDRQVPPAEEKPGEVLDEVNRQLFAGRNVLAHCRQGVGRSGLVAACLLVKNGMSPGAALEAVSQARGVRVPETSVQREWIERYAAGQLEVKFRRA